MKRRPSYGKGGQPRNLSYEHSGTPLVYLSLMSNEEIHQEISFYLGLLRNPLRYTGEEISEIGKALGYSFSSSTVAKASKDPNKSRGYRLNQITKHEIADVLRSIIRAESDGNPDLLQKLESEKIDISQYLDRTDVSRARSQSEVRDQVALVRSGVGPEGTAGEFINWNRSELLEENALKLDAITPTLNWARARLDRFIEEVGNNEVGKSKRVRIILLGDDGAGNRRFIENALEEKGLSGRMKILALYEVPDFHSVKGLYFPLPFDIAIYRDTRSSDIEVRKTIAVMNHTTVEKSVKKGKEIQQNLDRILNNVQLQEIEQWFNTMWKQHGEPLEPDEEVKA